MKQEGLKKNELWKGKKIIRKRAVLFLFICYTYFLQVAMCLQYPFFSSILTLVEFTMFCFFGLHPAVLLFYSYWKSEVMCFSLLGGCLEPLAGVP
jgi:hypothetical protein